MIDYSKENKTASKYTIFCDMDGVLTNFEKRFKDLDSNVEKLSPHEYDAKHGKWSIWNLIDEGGIEWWSEMEWISGGQELWEFILPYKPTILSAPSKNPMSRLGKMEWLKNNLHIKQDFYTVNPKKWKPHYKIVFNSKKYLFVRNEYDILIDDTPGKIEAWVKAGGIGILHTNVNDTITKLKSIIL